MRRHESSSHRGVFLEERSGLSVITVKGDLDADSLPETEYVLDSLVREGRRHILIDLTRAGFVACSAMSVLFEHADQMRLHGGSLKACGLRRVQKEIFQSMDFWDNMAMFEDRTGAILSCPVEVRIALGVDERRTGTDRRASDEPFRGRDRRARRIRRIITLGFDGAFAWHFFPPFEGPF